MPPSSTDPMLNGRRWCAMYARIQNLVGDTTAVLDAVSGRAGFATVAVLTANDGGGGTVITLWHTREDAERASERPDGSDDVYELDAEVTGQAAAQRPVAAFLGEFDGPLSPPRIAAARFAGTARIAPALREVPGLVRSLVMWHPTDRTMRVVHLTTSADALNDVAAAVTSTALLAGEDPTLLTGPDRVAIQRVLAYRTAPTVN
jgi:hypothetical protein